MRLLRGRHKSPHCSERGRSSGVEHNLAKVGVEGSNPFARSSFSWSKIAGRISRYDRAGLLRNKRIAETTITPTAAKVDDFVRFVARACLMQPATPAATTRPVERAAAASHSPGIWLLHTYLFLRPRLLDPDRFLTTALPFVRWIFSRAYLAALAVVIACPLFLVSQQWELFRQPEPADAVRRLLHPVGRTRLSEPAGSRPMSTSPTCTASGAETLPASIWTTAARRSR